MEGNDASERARRPYFIDKSYHNFTYIVKGNFSSLPELISIIREKGEKERGPV